MVAKGVPVNTSNMAASASFCSALKVVLWKNFIIRKYHWFLTLCEIAIPITLFILVAYVRSQITGKSYVPTPTYVQPKSADQLYAETVKSDTVLLYAPKTVFTSDLMDKARLKMGRTFADLKGFASEADLVTHYEEFETNKTVLGVVFGGVLGDKSPKHLNYVIRPFEVYMVFHTDRLFSPSLFYTPGTGSENYINSGFIALQIALDTAFAEMVSNNILPVTIMVQEFPYPPYLSDEFISDIFLTVLPLVTIFSFTFLCTTILKCVVQEKSTGIKELMKMMGLKSWMLWLGWFLHAFIVSFFAVLIITFFMKVPLWKRDYPPVEYCNGFLFFIFLLLYCASAITFCFAVSSFFNKPNFSIIVGIILWILSCVVPQTLIQKYPNMKWFNKILFSIFPNVALCFGYQSISLYETREVGINWSNLFKSASGGKEDITLGNVFIMFIVDMVLYMLITVYIENIKPGQYGLAKPFYFPLSYLYEKFAKINGRIKDDDENYSNQSCEIEEVTNLKPGIEVHNLYKKFGNQNVVSGLSIDIYESQITALLGHNGAGKTTTMSIITGMITATKGEVLINGCNIKRNMDKVRSSLGLCPQHNLQFTDLTVKQHLMFFAMLKGLSFAQARNEAESLLRKINLYGKADCLASSLSGGMRRKLSLGIALIGNSKVLILDEPTSGLDPEARREIWDILLSLRGSRTILITTHFMEEADVLGDRIAIMDHGHLLCYGTSMFLKNKYGSGYHLTIIRDTDKFKAEANQDCNQTDEITEVVCQKIPTAVLKTSAANHLTYLLPHEAKPLFSELLAELENKKDALGIANISMSVTTLEEVFLKVGSIAANENKQKASRKSDDSTSTIRSTNSNTSNATLISGEMGRMQLQFKSLFMKRFYVSWKKKYIFLIHFLLALIITLVTLYLGNISKQYDFETFPKFDFNLGKYGETSVFYGGSGYNTNLTAMEQYYDKLVATQHGIPNKVANVPDAIINKGKENIAYYKQHMVVSAEFNMTDTQEKIANAMYSNKADHGAPISLNLLMNAVLKGIMGNEYSITAANTPLPISMGALADEMVEVSVAVVWLLWFPLGVLFLAGAFLVFPQMERVTNMKQLQLMCGVRPAAYWLTCYAYDLILYFGSVFLILIIMQIFSLIYPNIFNGLNETVAIFAIVATYGLSVIPYGYLFTYKKTSSGALSLFIMASLFLSVILVIVVVVMQLSHDDYYEKLGKKLKNIFLLFPQFGLTYSSVQFSRKAVWNYNWDLKSETNKKIACYSDYNPCCVGTNTLECKEYRSYFGGSNSLTDNVIEMAVSTIIYFAILFTLEITFFRKCWNWIVSFIYHKMHPKKDFTDGKSHNEDVINETSRVYNTLSREKGIKFDVESQSFCDSGENHVISSFSNSNEDDLFLAHDLEKVYWQQKVVKGISFGVKPGDCFGLLGVNGAGKTTTFRMLTGDEPLIKGEAGILARNSKERLFISTNSFKYLENVGYCPQFNAINEILTGREMLRVFAGLRGISVGADEEVNYWLSALGLEEYADKPCGHYSGGNKRKLSMALALIGNPLLIMLDEPTSGVDPVSRRKLWDTLTIIQNQNNKARPSILLTSHSMEECEALCNRLAIMKAGQLECCGTVPELKQRYGQGFTVMLKLKLKSIASPLHSAFADNQSISSQSQPLNVASQSDTTSSQLGDLHAEKVKQVMNEFQNIYGEYCTLRDQHTGLLHYHISNQNKKWSELFNEIEHFKRSHEDIIEDYSISETTLEEVFLSIAKSE